MSSGLLAFLNEGVQTKPIHPAWAAHGGLIAARLAAHGAEGPPDVLDGRFGLYDVFIGDGAARGEQFADFGERWETLEISYKPFPACHYMHGSLTATTALLGRVGVEEIASIQVPRPGIGRRGRLRARAREADAAQRLRREVQHPVFDCVAARERPARRRHLHG